MLGYLKATGKATPAVSLDAEAKINIGYQRLLTFEVDGGGFDWFGEPPANVLLTGVALQQFTEMNEVYPIDLAIIERSRRWLLSKQRPDGSWTESQMPSQLTGGRGDLIVTAYSAWSLGVAGYRGPEVARAISWIHKNLEGVEDEYSLALVANALLTNDPRDTVGQQILADLDRRAERDATSAWWGKGSTTFCGGYGQTGQVETTALVALAMLSGRAYLDTATKALTYLVRSKSPQGGWASTQATILSLKALLRASIDLGQGQGEGVVEVKVNGQPAHRFEVAADQADVVQMVELSDRLVAGENVVELALQGKGSFNYQVCGRYYLPWSEVPKEELEKPLEIRVEYDRTTLAKDDTLDARVVVDYRGDVPTGMVIVDLGIPPGFEVDAGSFAELVGRRGLPKVERFSITGRQVTIYVASMERGKPLEFAYTLHAKYPLRAKTPSSAVYEYYAPDHRAEAEPVTLEVR